MAVSSQSRKIARDSNKQTLPVRGSSLGLKVDDLDQLVRRIIGGFSYDALTRFQRTSQLPWESIAGVIQIPQRTLARRKAAGKLTPHESERLLEHGVFMARYNLFGLVFGYGRRNRDGWLRHVDLGFKARRRLRNDVLRTAMWLIVIAVVRPAKRERRTCESAGMVPQPALPIVRRTAWENAPTASAVGP